MDTKPLIASDGWRSTFFEDNKLIIRFLQGLQTVEAIFLSDIEMPGRAGRRIIEEEKKKGEMWKEQSETSLRVTICFVSQSAHSIHFIIKRQQEQNYNKQTNKQTNSNQNKQQ